MVAPWISYPGLRTRWMAKPTSTAVTIQMISTLISAPMTSVHTNVNIELSLVEADYQQHTLYTVIDCFLIPTLFISIATEHSVRSGLFPRYNFMSPKRKERDLGEDKDQKRVLMKVNNETEIRSLIMLTSTLYATFITEVGRTHLTAHKNHK